MTYFQKGDGSEVAAGNDELYLAASGVSLFFLGWRYFLECRRYQTISVRGLGAAQNPQCVQGKALVGGPGGQSLLDCRDFET